MDEKKLNEVYLDAEFAFWEVVAKAYPEIETGDVGPFDLFEQAEMMKKWIRQWYKTNKGNKR
jgi:hypothetical protein